MIYRPLGFGRREPLRGNESELALLNLPEHSQKQRRFVNGNGLPAEFALPSSSFPAQEMQDFNSIGRPPQKRKNRMNKTIKSIFAASLCLGGFTFAAQVTWTTSPGLADTEVSTSGVQVFGYYWAEVGGAPVVVVNTAPFTLQQSTVAPSGLSFNGSYNNVEGVDLYQVALGAGNAGLNQILDGQNWGAAAPLTVTDLIPGQAYQLQFMISDDRPGFNRNRNYDVSDSPDAEGFRDIERAYHSTFGTGLPPGATVGSIEAKIFTGSFTADGTGTQEIHNILYENENHTGANSGSQVNAIQVRLIPEPATVALIGAALGVFALRRRRS